MTSVSRHTDVWLVRHTQTDWNQQRRYQSVADRPLTPFGCARAHAVTHRLRRITFSSVVSSGLGCTDLLADAVAAQQARPPQRIRDPRWQDADHGAWEGLTYLQIAQRFGRQASARWSDPWHSRAHGGESMSDLWSRVEAAWSAAVQQADGGRVLIVTHAAPIQLLLCALLKLSFDQYWQLRIDLGGVTNVDLYPSGAIIRVINEVPPLLRINER